MAIACLCMLQVGNTNPYAHWTWTFNTDKNGTANNCTKALAAQKYDQWSGLDPTNVTQQDDQALYQNTTGTDLKYGWVVTSCASTMAYICQVPSSIFPCMPPPASPPPPPQPPSPPSPPMTTRCEHLCSAALGCAGLGWAGLGWASGRAILLFAKNAVIELRVASAG
jgi:hypothetical protein